MNERFYGIEFLNNRGKEVSEMLKRYETPELTQVGQAEEVVLGSVFVGDDFPQKSAFDFEFEQD